MRWRSRSMSSTLIRTVSPIATTSEGWLTWLQESSEMWIRPSIPSRSTKAPKSTMLEILPSTTWPGSRRPRICSRTSLRSSSSTARRESTTLLRLRLSSITLHSSVWPSELVEVVDAADVDQRGGQEAAHPEVEDEAALDDLDHAAFDRFARLGGGLDAAPGLLEAGALLGEDEAALGVLLGEDEGVDLLAQLDLVGRVDRLADRELVRGDDALRLVADVDQDLVLVDPHDLALDDVALLEGDHRRRVVRHDLAVDFEQQAVGALDRRAGGRRRSQVSVADTAASRQNIAARPLRADHARRPRSRWPSVGCRDARMPAAPNAATSARPSTAATTC